MKRYLFWGILVWGNWLNVVYGQETGNSGAKTLGKSGGGLPVFIVDGLLFEPDTVLNAVGTDEEVILKRANNVFRIRPDNVKSLDLMKTWNTANHKARRAVVITTSRGRKKITGTQIMMAMREPVPDPGTGVEVQRPRIVCLAPLKRRSFRPLYLIDGVRKHSHWYRKNPCRKIDPGKVKSFAVLQGQKNTAAFGRRATDGVVILVTKDFWTEK